MKSSTCATDFSHSPRRSREYLLSIRNKDMQYCKSTTKSRRKKCTLLSVTSYSKDRTIRNSSNLLSVCVCECVHKNLFFQILATFYALQKERKRRKGNDRNKYRFSNSYDYTDFSSIRFASMDDLNNRNKH